MENQGTNSKTGILIQSIEQGIVASLPTPPPFYQFYSDNSNYEALPPPPTVNGTYAMFGKVYTVRVQHSSVMV